MDTMRRRERAEEGGLPFEIPPIDAGGGVGGRRGVGGGLGNGAERRASCGAGRAGGVGAGHRGRMTRKGGVGKGLAIRPSKEGQWTFAIIYQVNLLTRVLKYLNIKH